MLTSVASDTPSGTLTLCGTAVAWCYTCAVALLTGGNLAGNAAPILA